MRHMTVAGSRPPPYAFFTMLDWLSLLVAGPVVGYSIERNGYALSFLNLALVVSLGIAGFYTLDRPRTAAGQR